MNGQLTIESGKSEHACRRNGVAERSAAMNEN